MKKFNLLLAITLLTLINSNAQDRKFRFGMSLMPNITKGIINVQPNDPYGLEESYKDQEEFKPSLNAAFFGEYQLNARLFLGCGLGYQNTGSKTTMEYPTMPGAIDPDFLGSPIDEDNGLGINNSEKFVSTQIHHNLEVPVYLRHRIGENYFVLLGTSAVINFSNQIKGTAHYIDGSRDVNRVEDNSVEYSRFNVTGNFGFGMDYWKNEKMSLFVCPFVQCAFLGAAQSVSINRNYFSIGLSTGIRI